MIEIPTIGSKAEAEAVCRRAESSVPAYGLLLDGKVGVPFEQRPLTDKSNYVGKFDYAKILGDDYASTFSIFASSGSSGKSMYWPQLKGTSHGTVARLRQFLERHFQVHERRTLAVVGLALGSWIGGEHCSWALKSLGHQVPYPFAVFTPGSRHEEIVRFIASAAGFVDQVILVVCPSAIGHLLLLAKTLGVELPLKKMRYLVLGEPMTEAMRETLQELSGVPRTESFLFSIYGSADTGLLGVESLASVTIRKLLTTDARLREQLGFPEAVPHFFHCIAEDAFMETVGRELCITRWQGVPLMRYNLHDDVRLLGWTALREVVLAGAERTGREDLLAVLAACPAEAPDILAVSGRADRSLILCGTNLSESMLDEAIRCPRLADLLTGLYRARIDQHNGRQHLELRLEIKPHIELNPELSDRLYHQLIVEIGRVQPEFADDWQNVYRRWDDDRPNRILQISLLPWPSLANDPRIKQRGVES